MYRENVGTVELYDNYYAIMLTQLPYFIGTIGDILSLFFSLVLLFKLCLLKHLTKSDIAIRSNALDGDINIGNRIRDTG